MSDVKNMALWYRFDDPGSSHAPVSLPRFIQNVTHIPSSSLTSFNIPAGSFKYEDPKEPSLLMRTALRPRITAFAEDDKEDKNREKQGHK